MYSAWREAAHVNEANYFLERETSFGESVSWGAELRKRIRELKNKLEMTESIIFGVLS